MTAATRATITLYVTPECHLCEQAIEQLRELRDELDLAIEIRDITADERLHRAYFERVPVIELEGVKIGEYTIDEQVLREALESRR